MITEETKKNKTPFYQTWMTIVYNINLQIVDIINPQHCMLLQLTADDLLGKSVVELEKITEGANKEPARIMAKNVKKAMRENRNVYFEYSTTHKDGSVTYAICYAEKGPDELLYVNVIKIDEENIFEVRDGFTNYVINTTINNISVGVYMRQIHEDGTKSYILYNDVAKEFYESEDVQQSSYWNQQEEDLADEKALELRDQLKIERVFRDGEGNIKRWLIVTKKKIITHAKGFYIVTTIIDITKRRQHEILLEQQFALLDSMYEQLPVGIVIYNKEGKLVSLNQKNMNMYGVSNKEEVIGIDIFDEPYTPSDSKERLLAGENVEYEIMADFNGQRRVILVKSSIIKNKKGEIDGYLKICDDVTEKKNTEYKLSQKHKLIETIYNTLPIGIEVYDNQGRLIEVNNYDMQMMGVSSKESILGKNFFDNPNVPDEIKERTRSGEDLEYMLDYDFDLASDFNYYDPTIRRKLYLNIKSSTIRDDDNRVDCYLLVNQDRTKTVEHARLLEETAAKLSTIFNSMSTGVEIYDRDGLLVDCNNFHLKIFGIEHKEDLLNLKLKLSDNPNISPEDMKRLTSGEEFALETVYDFDLIRKNNYYPTIKTGCINLSIKASPMVTNSGEVIGFVVEMNDITLAQLQKDQLKTAQDNLAIALNAGNVIAWVYDIKDNVFSILHDGVLGSEEISWDENCRIIHPDDVLLQKEKFDSLISGEKLKNEAIFRYMLDEDPDKYHYFEAQMVAKKEKDQVAFITGTLKDVTNEFLYKQDLEKAHRQSEYSLSLLTNVIEKIPLALFIKDTYDDYKYAIANEKMGMLLNINKKDIIGQNDYDLFDKQTAEIFRAEDQEVIAAGGTPITTIRPMNFNGTETMQEITEAVFTTVDGRRLIVGVVADVTEEYREKQELKDYRTKTHLIINACEIAQWDYDLSTKKTFSPHEKSILPNQAFTVNEHLAFVHPEDRALLTDFYDKMNARVDCNVEARFRMKMPDRSDYSDMIMNGAPLKNSAGVIVAYTGLRRDMTEWNTINRQLVEERQKAEAADKLKSAFLANMSHEIRTPLNAIVGFSELLQTIDDETEKNEYISIINNNNELLLRLISDILDLSKIESGLVELKPELFDMSVVFYETYMSHKARCTNPNIEFRGSNPYRKCMVKLDKNRILQVCTNFITNAIKYTPSGLIVMGYEYVDGGLRIYVKDSGIGVSKEKQKLLFQRFSKLDDFAQGTGLGLAICKAITDVMGGKIGCESHVNVGSTFWAWIPCDAEIDYKCEEEIGQTMAFGANTNHETEQENRSKKYSLLVAEDNDSNYMLIRAMLDKYSLTRAENGAEAIVLTLKNRYDAILMDVRMPVMDGVEATRKIRTFNKTVPIIALTANAFDSDKAEAMEAGCNAFITKPLKKVELENALREV